VEKEFIKSIDLVRRIAGASVRGSDIFNKRSLSRLFLLSLLSLLPLSSLSSLSSLSFSVHLAGCALSERRRHSKWLLPGHALGHTRACMYAPCALVPTERWGGAGR